MDDRDAMHMMTRCSNEIKTLRARISFLEPKAQAYDLLCTVVGSLLPNQNYASPEDLTHRLDREASTLRDALAAAEATDIEAPEVTDAVET
jgi:hypothetical protein